MLVCLAWDVFASPTCRDCLRNLALRLLTKVPLYAFGAALAFAPLLSSSECGALPQNATAATI